MNVWTALVLFVGSAAAIVWAGPATERVTSRLAHGIGGSRSVFAAVFLGVSTSLPGFVVTAIAALRGNSGLAVSNALGGVLAQAAFIGVADFVARGPLERRASNRDVMAQTGILFALVGLLAFALARPQAALGPVHAVTPMLAVTYIGGMFLVRSMDRGDTPPAPDDRDRPAGGQLWLRYALLVGVLFAAGVAISFAVDPLAGAMGLSLTAAGAVLTAPATSLPELVTALSAARNERPRMTMGDLIGSNSVDMLMVAVADLFARSPLFPRLGSAPLVLTAGIVVMHAVLLFGLVREGAPLWGRVDAESLVMLGVYLAVAAVVVVG